MPIPEKRPKVRRTSIRDELYPTLLEWITTGELAPGETLNDRQLAEALGVSRTPVREALQRLKDEGWVETEANRWTRVAPIDRTSTANLYDIISALEALAIKSAGPKLTTRDLEYLESTKTRLAAALAEHDQQSAWLADEAFHNVFVEKSGNEELQKIVGQVRSKLRRIEIAYFAGSSTAAVSVEDHERVVEALGRRSYDEAADAVARNWAQALMRVREMWQE